MTSAIVISQNYEKEIKQEIKLIRYENVELNMLEFEICSVPESINQCLRRCIMEDVPSCVVDKVQIINNDGEVSDPNLELLLLQIPIDIDPKPFKVLHHHKRFNFERVHDMNDKSTLLFEINVNYTTEESGNSKIDIDDVPFIIQKAKAVYVKSDCMKWIEFGDQKKFIQDVNPIKGILLNVLEPNCSFNAKLAAFVSSGKYNCKFNPCSFLQVKKRKLMQIVGDLTDEEKEMVMKILDKPGKELIETTQLYINDKLLRKFINSTAKFESFKKKFEIKKVFDRMLWYIESLRPEKQSHIKIFKQALNLSIDKTTKYAHHIVSEYRTPTDFKTDLKFLKETRVQLKDEKKHRVVQMTKDLENLSFIIILSGNSTYISLALKDVINDMFGDRLDCLYDSKYHIIQIENNAIIENYTDLSVLQQSLKRMLQTRKFLLRKSKQEICYIVQFYETYCI